MVAARDATSEIEHSFAQLSSFPPQNPPTGSCVWHRKLHGGGRNSPKLVGEGAYDERWHGNEGGDTSSLPKLTLR